MLSYTVACLLLVSNVFALPQANRGFEPEDGPSILSQLPQEWQNNLNPHARQDLGAITAKDLLVLKNVVHELPKFTSIGQARQTLKQYSPRLEKLVEQHVFKAAGIAAQKRAQLLPETRSAFHQAANISKTYAKSLVELVKSQTPEVKKNLDTTFPHASFVLNAPLVKQLLAHLERH